METTHAPTGAVVVGVDGSSSADHAIEWAAHAAALENRPLVLVHAAHLLGTGGSVWLDSTGIDHARLLEDVQAAGQALLSAAADKATRRESGIVIHQILSAADPRQALLDLAADAAMIVVGSRGRGPIESLLLGSVSLAVSKHATCPVVVLRPRDPSRPRYGILVGADGTEHSHAAIEFAYRMASLRERPLTVLHCYWDAAHIAEGERDVPDDETGVDDERALLAEAVAGMSEKFPDVEAHLKLTRGFADKRLIHASRDSDMIVVGSHRMSVLSNLVYGSVTPTVVEHAECSVAVVPSTAS